MAKLFSSKAELIALRGLCSRNNTVSGYILSQVDETFFRNKGSKEAYRKIRSYISNKGAPPTFKILCEDVSLREDTREFLTQADAAPSNLAQSEQLVSSLDEYRKTRMCYHLAESVLNDLQAPKIDIGKMIDTISQRVAQMLVRRSLDESIWHMGKDSNIEELIEQVLSDKESEDVIPTGFGAFDKVNGGFLKGSLVTIGGGSGSGKCCGPETLVTLSTLTLTLEDGSQVKVEGNCPVKIIREEAVMVVTASDLQEGDDLIRILRPQEN